MQLDGKLGLELSIWVVRELLPLDLACGFDFDEFEF
jgi:hypothetical protein